MNGLAGVEGHTHSSVIAECLTSPSPVEAPSTTPGLLRSIREKKKVKNQDQDLWETRLWSGVVFLICNISSTSPCSVVKGLGCNASGVCMLKVEGKTKCLGPGLTLKRTAAGRTQGSLLGRALRVTNPCPCPISQSANWKEL